MEPGAVSGLAVSVAMDGVAGAVGEAGDGTVSSIGFFGSEPKTDDLILTDGACRKERMNPPPPDFC